MLGELLLGLSDGAKGRVEQDRAGGGGALVDSEDMGHWVGPAGDVSTVDKRERLNDYKMLTTHLMG